MKIRTIALATAAISLAATPAIAQVVFERANAPVEGENSLEGESNIILAVLGGAAVFGALVAASGGGDNDPASP